MYQKANMRVGKISNCAEYRKDVQFQNFVIFEIVKVEKKSEKLLTFQFEKFRQFPISKISNLVNQQISQMTIIE